MIVQYIQAMLFLVVGFYSCHQLITVWCTTVQCHAIVDYYDTLLICSILQPSSASLVSSGELTMRKLFHALDDEGFRVPTAVSNSL